MLFVVVASLHPEAGPDRRRARLPVSQEGSPCLRPVPARLGRDVRAAYRPSTADVAPARVLRADRGVCTVLDSAGVDPRQPGGAVLPAPPATRPACRAPATGWCCDAGRTTASRSRRAAPAHRDDPAHRRQGRHRSGAGRQHGHRRGGRADAPGARPGPRRAAARAGLGVRRPAAGRAHQERHRARPGAVARQLAALAPGVRCCRSAAPRARPRADPPARRARPHAGPARQVRRRQVDAGQRAGRDEVMPVQRSGEPTARAGTPPPTGGWSRCRGGGAVLDTPGIRGVGLLDGAAGLDRAFADVAELAAACRFADCGHDGEPGCAVARRWPTARCRRAAWRAGASCTARSPSRAPGGPRGRPGGRASGPNTADSLWHNAPVRAVNQVLDEPATLSVAAGPGRARRGADLWA